MKTVTWRQTTAALLAAVLTLGALVVVFRSDGLPAVDASAARATRWFVHQPSGNLVLADGYGGRALASIPADPGGSRLRVVEGGPGAYVVNDSLAEVRSIDSAELRLGPVQGVATLESVSSRAIAGVGSSGLVVVDATGDAATLVPVTGEVVPYDADVGTEALIAADGAIWSLGDTVVRRTTSAGSTTRSLDDATADGTTLSLVGSRPFVVDGVGTRARLGDGEWIDLPTDVDASEIVVQQPGPSSSCGWVAANDDLWCVSDGKITETARVSGLDVDGSDLLAIAGDAAVLLRRGPTVLQRFDWRSERLLDSSPASVATNAVLDVTATVDLVWIDDVAGQFVWAVNPWGIVAIDKDDGATLVLGNDGEIVDDGNGEGAIAGTPVDGTAQEPEEREPDDNGIDDPPVAIDDPVTSRAGRSVQVPVTANDYDPDGEAIAVVGVGSAGHGSVEIGTASTVTFTPEPGYVGLDEFEYTIADGNGAEASATVFIELIPLDGANQPPVGAPDQAETGADVAVVVDVLLNDIDPDRDPLQIDSFEVLNPVGSVTETIGPSGLSALRYQPLDGFEGDAEFTYRPIDSYGALGDDVTVTVSVARVGDENRPPIVRPDSVRLRRGVETQLPVLVNDEDPDGDTLTVGVVEPLPDGLDVEVQGAQLAITARTGSSKSVPFEYTVDDGVNEPVVGSVLVDVIDDVEPNRPPIAVADAGTAVVGRSIEVEVLVNDSDPDGDRPVVVAATQPANDRGRVVVLAPDKIQFTPTPLTDAADAIARFTYTIDDGYGHQVVGDVTVTVLPEALPEPPYAKDDSTFTFVGVPVTVDVLRNDGDPSGERPLLTGRPGCVSGGRALVTADNQVRFTPPAGQSGAFRCTYEVTNSRGLRAGASILISVREPLVTNEPPNARLDQLTVEVGKTDTIDVTANDDDPDGDNSALKVVSSTTPSIGTATRSGNRITFTAGSVVGVTAINYQIQDVDGAVSVGSLSIRVIEPINVAPIANADSRVITGPGVPTSFDVLANDSDANDARSTLIVEGVSIVSGDGTSARSGNVVTITPNPEFVGNVVATYTVRDPGGLTATAFVTLSVLKPLNRPPVAKDDVNEVTNGGSVSTPVLLNDSDPDGDQLSLTITSGPDSSLGQASAGGGSISFNATPGASGTASIVYSVSDGEFSNSATLRVTVRPCSQSAPVANDAFLATGYRQPIAVDLGAYSSNGQITDVAGPSGYSGGVYTPPAGENGNVSISYAVVNNCRQRATGRITIDVNQDPVAQATAATLGRGASREFPVSSLAGDREPLTISGSSGAPGWVTTESARIVVAPPIGTAATTYNWTTTVVDPGGLTAVVPMSITVQNAAPTAAGDSADVSGGPATVGIVGNDSDPDADNGALRIQQIPSSLTFSNGVAGSITVSADQRSVTIDPLGGLGVASFQYTVVDGDGAVSNAATVNVTGAVFNQAPTANDQTVNVNTGVPISIVLDVNDVDGDPLTVVPVDNAAQVVTGVSGTTVTVIATTSGRFTYAYRVTDGRAQSRIATLTIIATPPATTTTVAATTTTVAATTTTTTTTVAATTTSSTVAATTTSSTAPPAAGG